MRKTNAHFRDLLFTLTRVRARCEARRTNAVICYANQRSHSRPFRVFFTESFACTDTLTHVLFGGAAVQSCAACTEVCSETLSTLNQRFLDGFDLTINQRRLLAPRRVSQFFQKVSLAPNFTKSKDKNTNLCSRTLFLLIFSGWKAAGRRCSNTASVIKCYLCL